MELLDQRRLLAADIANVGIIYDGSSFSDEIASDKTPYRLGDGAADFANYTSYPAGINAIAVDFADLAGTPTEADFSFRVGNDQDPSGWETAPAPVSIDVAPGAGFEGSDRVTIRWNDNDIENEWLEVTVLATANTGLARPNTFYWGNQIGETGNGFGEDAVDFDTDVLTIVDEENDVAAIPNNASGREPVPIDNPFDINRDGRINVVDHALVQANLTAGTSLAVLDLGESIPITFQDGIDGYDGTVDINPLQVSPDLVSGDFFDTIVENPDTAQSQGLIRFEGIFSQIPEEAEIVNATVSFYTFADSFSDGASEGNIKFHRMLSPWGNDSTWNSLTDGVTPDDVEAASVPTAVLSQPGSEQFHTIDVTRDVVSWFDGEENLGWVAINDSDDDWNFWSSEFETEAQRPKLTISYVTDNPVATFQDGVDGYDQTVDIQPDQENPDATSGDFIEISADRNENDPNETPTRESQGLIRFDGIFGEDPGQVPLGSSITYASLTFTTNSSSDNNISFHRMLTPWDNDSTWNTLGGGVNPDGTQAVTSATDVLVNPVEENDVTPHTIDVTSDVQLWSDGESNFGWAALNDGSDGWDFWSSEFDTTRFRPRLSINFVPPASGGRISPFSINPFSVGDFCVSPQHETPIASDANQTVSDSNEITDTIFGEIGYASVDPSSDGDSDLKIFGGGNLVEIENRIVAAEPSYLVPVKAQNAVQLNAIALSFGLDDGDPPPSTTSFQDGVDDYDGTLDINPWEVEPDTPSGDETDISVDLSDGGGEREGLIRFEGLFGDGAGQIPTEGAIVSARVTFWTNSDSGGDISFHRMLVDWDNDSTWNTFGPDGVTQDDIESVSTPTAILSEPGDDMFHTIDVTDDVQLWLEGAAPNLGWVAINDSGDGWDFDSSEVSTIDQRPLLTVEFAERKAVRATDVVLDQTVWDTDGDEGSVVTPAVSEVTATPAFPTKDTVVDVFGAAVDSFVEVEENDTILFFDLDLSSRVPGDTITLTPNFEGFTVAIGPNLAPLDVSTFMTGILTITELGDANGDGALTNQDIQPFVQALTDPAGYAAEFPAIDVSSVLDFNGDDRFTNADIAGFVDALTGST